MAGYVTDTYGNTLPQGTSAFNGARRGATPTGFDAPPDTSQILSGADVAIADPPNLAVMITAPTTATLTWDAAVLAGVVDYSLFRRTPPSGAAFVPGVDTPVAAGIVGLTYGETALAALTNYEWQVFGRVSGVAGWTPASLPSLVGWYDAADLGSITASGGSVSQWSDKSGNGHHLTQATGSAQPITGTRTINGRNVLDFDGSNHLFVFASHPLPSAAAGTALYVFQSDSDPSGVAAILDGFGACDDQDWFETYSDGNVYDGWGSTVRKTVGNPADSYATNPVQISKVAAASDWRYYVNAVPLYSTVTNTVSFSGGVGPQIGKTGVSGFRTDGRIAEIIICAAGLSGADRQAAEAYLRAKWGTPAPWTPASLSGLEGWYDASDLATITASSGLVSAWADKSGNGRTVSQATGTMQPTTGAVTQNGFNTLSTWALKTLGMTGLPSIPSGAATFWAVARLADSAVYGEVHAFNGFAWSPFIGTLGGGGRWGYYDGAYRADVNGMNDGVVHVIVCTRQTDTTRAYRDGTESPFSPNVGSGVPAPAITAFAVGRPDAPSFGFADPTVICEIGWCSSVLSSGDLANLNAYLKGKWGTP